LSNVRGESHDALQQRVVELDVADKLSGKCGTCSLKSFKTVNFTELGACSQRPRTSFASAEQVQTRTDLRACYMRRSRAETNQPGGKSYCRDVWTGRDWTCLRRERVAVAQRETRSGRSLMSCEITSWLSREITPWPSHEVSPWQKAKSSSPHMSGLASAGALDERGETN